MSQTLDGVSSTASQHGAKQVILPLQSLGNYYATEVRRPMMCAPASAYSPIRNQLTASGTVFQQLKHSDSFSAAAWTAVGAAAVADSTTDPEGRAHGTAIFEDTGTSAHNLSQTLLLDAALLHRAVVFLKAGTRSFARLRWNNATDGNVGATVFNLATGVVVSGPGQIKAMLNGWFACFTLGTTTVSSSDLYVDLSPDGTTFSYLGTGAYIYAWRATAYPGLDLYVSAYGPAIQTTTAGRYIIAPAVDPDDPIAFLVDESEPEGSSLEIGVARWARTYANVPADVVRYSSRTITKPTIPNEAAASVSVRAYGASNTEIATGVRNNTGWWTSDDNVYSPFTSISTTTTAGNATAGTFTLTYKADTTAALNFNANNATIAAALNGLASVIADGLTFSVATSLSGGVGGFIALTITAGSTAFGVALDPNGLTVSPASGKKAFNYVGSSTLQYVQLARSLTAASHGIGIGTGGALLAVNTNLAEAYVLPEDHWAVYDANTLQVSDIFTTGITTDSYGTLTHVAAFLRTYTPGLVPLSARITEKYYLPGVTLGIATAADIPIEIPTVSDADVIAAVLGAGGMETVDFQGPDFWDGRAPIYRTVKTEVDFDDI